MSNCVESCSGDITVEADLKALAAVRGFVAERAVRAGLAGGKLQNVELALEEIAVNVVSHAYPAGGGRMEVRCGVAGDAEFFVQVRDSGSPFNPLERKMPDFHLGLEERAPGGLGIFLARRVSDRMEYRRERGFNVLTMFFGLKERKKKCK